MLESGKKPSLKYHLPRYGIPDINKANQRFGIGIGPDRIKDLQSSDYYLVQNTVIC